MNILEISAILAVCVGLMVFIPKFFIKRKLKEYPEHEKYDILTKNKRILVNIIFISLTVLVGELIFLKDLSIYASLCLLLFAVSAECITLIDMRIRIIPNLIIYFMTAVMILFIFLTKGWQSTLYAVLFITGAVLILDFLATKIYKTTGEYIGGGDLKYLIVLAVMFAYGLNSNAILGMAVGFVGSILVDLVPKLIAKKITLHSMISFGPYVSVGILTGIAAFCVML